MKFKLPAIIILITSALLMSGCRTSPVYNVSDIPFPNSRETDITQKEIAKAIMSAGYSLGWVIEDQGNGHMQGTLVLRSHTAVVDIFYNNSKFSITYKDSTNLNYDGNNIHSQYNNWIINLTNKINSQIVLL